MRSALRRASLAPRGRAKPIKFRVILGMRAVEVSCSQQAHRPCQVPVPGPVLASRPCARAQALHSRIAVHSCQSQESTSLSGAAAAAAMEKREFQCAQNCRLVAGNPTGDERGFGAMLQGKQAFDLGQGAHMDLHARLHEQKNVHGCSIRGCVGAANGTCMHVHAAARLP